MKNRSRYFRLALAVAILLGLGLATVSEAARKAKKGKGKAAPQAVRPPAPPAAAPAAPGNLTFFVISDLHYNYPKAGSYVPQRTAIRAMNATPGIPYPPGLGGTVDVPRGVIALGDLTESPGNGAWTTFVQDFGLTGERLLRFPVFEGLGNHDAGGQNAWDGLRKRNARRPGLDAVSANGYHYAWVWNGIHFVMTGVCPANDRDRQVKDGQNARGALDFLYQYLRQRVGDSGRPVVLLQHLALGGERWWSDAQIDSFHKVIQNYNILCIMHGHTHEVHIRKWRGIDVIDDGGLKKGHPNFFVFRVEGTRITGLMRTTKGAWGDARFEKTFSYGKGSPGAPSLP